MEITKEMIEKELGCEISDFKVEPLYQEEVCVGLKVLVTPTPTLKHINIELTVSKSSDFDEESNQ